MLRYLLAMSLALSATVAAAKDVQVTRVELERSSPGWTFHVTFKHQDQDYQHYVSAWRIVDDKKKVLAYEEFYHPHLNQKSFTESKANIVIPAAVKIVYVEAEAKPHGWSKQRVRIDLTKAKGAKYVIRQKTQ
ncbi:MAG: hypothetical protein HY080_09345 [Gammaproteobacteria bacterium]|nr:hypothetical protein [Gammaproteobacteria bacterium]